MPARLHAFVQHPDNFDQARLNHAVVEHMHRPPHLRVWVVAASVTNMKTADVGQKFGAISRRGAFWISARPPCPVPPPGLPGTLRDPVRRLR
jgi:hypothetical protein